MRPWGHPLIPKQRNPVLRCRERLRLLTLLLIIPLIMGFYPEQVLPPEELEPQPLSPVEEILLLERVAHQIELQRKRELEKLTEKQEHLQDLGWYEGEVDGIKGPLTEQALEEFTDAAELEHDSQLAVLIALRQDDAPKAPPPPPPSSNPSASTSTNASGIPNHWLELARCESGNWVNGGASFEGPIRWWWAKPGTEVPPWGTRIHHGGFQFHPGTWSAYRSSHHPQFAYDATPQQQYEVAQRVQASQGWQAWPVCSRKVGLR